MVMQRSPILPEPALTRGDVHIESERCKGCELCVEYCPTKVLNLSTEYNAKGYHFPIFEGGNCICCQACYTICPEFAIFATPTRSVDTTTPASLTN